MSQRWRWLWSLLSTTTCSHWPTVQRSERTGEESVHSLVDEQGSRGGGLVLSAVKGLNCIQPVNFCQKGKRMKIHAQLITHYLWAAAGQKKWNFYSCCMSNIQFPLAQLDYNDRTFLDLYVLRACASEDHFYPSCRLWVRSLKREEFLCSFFTILSCAIRRSYTHSHHVKCITVCYLIFCFMEKQKYTCAEL